MLDKCAEPCPFLPRLEALEEDSRHNKEAHKEFYSKLEASHTSVALIEQRLNQIKEDTEEIKTTVQVMRDKPGKRWEGAVEKVIYTALGAIVAYLLLRLGLPA